MEVTAGSVGKGAAIVGVGSAGGYGIYSAIPGKESDAASTDDSNSESSRSDQIPTSEDNSPKYLFNIQGFGSDSSEYKKSAGNFGYAFGKFMLDPDQNEEIWKQNGEKLKANNGNYLNPKFKEIKDKSDVTEKLKDLCKEIYKNPRTDIVNSDASSHAKDSVWTYCTNFGLRPITIKESNSETEGYAGKWAAESNNKEALISVNDFGNSQDTWNHIYTNILKKDLSNESKKSSINKKFVNLANADGLYNACKAAYETSARNNDVDNYGRSVIDYCVLDISIDISKFPTEPS